MRQLGTTGIEVFDLCLGGNVFGWTASEPESFAVLDRYVAAGGNYLDTADAYMAMAEGKQGGESETVIGNWMASRRNRDDLVIATKVGLLAGAQGLSATSIRRGIEGSLRRLRTEWVDVYFTHRDDPHTPLEETLGTLDALVREGKVRHLGASGSPAARLVEALAVSEEEGLRAIEVVTFPYNLIDRQVFEGELQQLCAARGLACVPFFGLARGFLTGKYRPGSATRSARDAVDGLLSRPAHAYLDERGTAVLAALDEVAGAHGTTVAAVALAWVRDQVAVVAPIASARTPGQLEELLAMADLALNPDELHALAVAGGLDAPAPAAAPAAAPAPAPAPAPAAVAP